MHRMTIVAALWVTASTVASASPYDAESSPQGHMPTMTREVYAQTGALDAAIAADREYIDGMRRHHRGAVTMARAYLADRHGRHPLMTRLARAIVANQAFELALLDEVERHLAVPPRRLAGSLVSRRTGWDGLEHTLRFLKYPPPGFLELWLDSTPIAVTEVRFAKAMIIHHRAAVDMARAYNRDRTADNRVLKALNRDIEIDQEYEIGLMRRLVGRFPGDAAAVEPGTIEGMPQHDGH